MADSRGITDLPLEIYAGEMPNAGVSDTQVSSVMGTLSNSCRGLHRLFQPDLIKRATKQLWQAAIDDDRKAIVKIATAQPDLLLQLLITDMPKGFVIQSKYTHQKFDLEGENILAVAAKRKQIKMIETLLSCFDTLEQTSLVKERIVNALAQWSLYETAKNAQNEDGIVIPREYSIYAQSLIDVFREETFPNGKKGKFSEKTELALSSLFNILLPKNAVKLDDAVDPELFLLALYKAYRDNFDLFQNWGQRDAFCARMIGLAQSVLSPETAKIFCEGLYNVVEDNTKISERAEALKLLSGESFYRPSRESLSGLGFEYLCGWAATRAESGVGLADYLSRMTVLLCVSLLEKLCRAKATSFRNITLQLQQQPNCHSANDKRGGCVIL